MLEVRELERLLKNGKITRREFMARVAALGFTVAASPVLLSTPVHASKPKKGGRLRIGTTGGNISDSMDPGQALDSMVTMITWQLRNCLVEIDHNTEPQPELAESWDVTPDAAKWIFKIRKGVEFHNGKTLNAEDIVFSINHHRKEESKSGGRPLLSSVKDVRADGRYTVIFTLNEGYADFPFILSDFHFQITPAGTMDFEKGIGTGGYILESWEPGVRALVKRNPNYWKEGRAHFDEVETLSIQDLNARINALKSGQVDVINRCDPKIFHIIDNTPGLKGIKTTGFRHYTWPMLTDRAPFNNNDARLAMKYAIDREQMLKMIVRGYGIPGNDHPISPKNRYQNDELPQRQYDPEKAKHHIKKAGLEGHTFNLHVSDTAYTGAVDAAVLYKEQAAKAGININVVREPSDGYWSNVWRKKTWSACYWAGRATEDWMFSTVYAEGVPWNDTLWKHDRFNKLLKEARPELDKDKRRAMYYEMQKILRDEGGVVVYAFVNYLSASTDKIEFGPLAVNLDLDGWRCAERWWFGS